MDTPAPATTSSADGGANDDIDALWAGMKGDTPTNTTTNAQAVTPSSSINPTATAKVTESTLTPITQTSSSTAEPEAQVSGKGEEEPEEEEDEFDRMLRELKSESSVDTGSSASTSVSKNEKTIVVKKQVKYAGQKIEYVYVALLSCQADCCVFFPFYFSFSRSFFHVRVATRCHRGSKLFIALFSLHLCAFGFVFDSLFQGQKDNQGWYESG